MTLWSSPNSRIRRNQSLTPGKSLTLEPYSRRLPRVIGVLPAALVTMRYIQARLLSIPFSRARRFDSFQNSPTSQPTFCMKPCACMSSGDSVRSKS